MSYESIFYNLIMIRHSGWNPSLELLSIN